MTPAWRARCAQAGGLVNHVLPGRGLARSRFSTRLFPAACGPTLQSDCVGSYLDPSTGDLQQREWTNMWLNFDNVSCT